MFGFASSVVTVVYILVSIDAKLRHQGRNMFGRVSDAS